MGIILKEVYRLIGEFALCKYDLYLIKRMRTED